MKLICAFFLSIALISSSSAFALIQRYPSNCSCEDYTQCEFQDCSGIAYEDSLYSPNLFPSFIVGAVVVTIVLVAVSNCSGGGGHGGSSSCSSCSSH